MNANDYYNSSECYSDPLFDVNGQFKENKSCFRVNKRKGIHSSIGEKLATILGNLHLILVYYSCTTSMLNFSPLEQELVSLFMKQYK